MKQFYMYMKKYPGLMIGWSILMLLSIFFQITATLLNANLLNAIIAMDVMESFTIMGCILASWLVYLFFEYGKRRTQNHLIGLVNSDLRASFLNAMCTYDYETFHQKDAGAYSSSFTNDINQIELNGTKSFFSFIENIVMALFSLIALTLISLWLSGISLILFLIIYFVPKLFDQSLKKRSLQFSSSQETYTRKIKNLLQGFDVFSDYDATDLLKRRMGEHSTELEVNRCRFYNLQDGIGIMITVLNISVQLINNCVCIALILMNQITAGSIMSAGNLSGKLFSSLSSLSEQRVKITSCIQLLEKYQTQEHKNQKVLVSFEQELKMEHITFAYEDTPILRDLSLAFEKNKKYAIVGDSGCGKSTLLKIISGKLTGYQGSYTIDNVSLKQVKLADFKKQVAYIDQNAVVFDETIKENLTLGKTYTIEEILHAVSAAGLDDFIHNANDLEKRIENNGDNLSGGQRQRIMIARSILANKQIYLIDEATSNLDQANMEQVESYLLSDPKITLIYISHHLSDQIKQRFDEVYTLPSNA